MYRFEMKFRRLRADVLVCASVLAGLGLAPASFAADDSEAQAALWFEQFKDEASPQQLHQFLSAMPKGVPVALSTYHDRL